jgi:DUF177 domain-containing protein
MGHKTDILDLAQIAPGVGDGGRIELEVEPGRLSFGDQAYEIAGERIPVRVDVSRANTGYAMRLRFDAELDGPCVRCLDPAEVTVAVDAREVDQAATEDAELRSPYVDGDELDLAGWAHDALALAMPGQFLCRPDCAGLCPVCGESLNDADAAEHRHESSPDPRFAKLRELSDPGAEQRR